MAKIDKRIEEILYKRFKATNGIWNIQFKKAIKEIRSLLSDVVDEVIGTDEQDQELYDTKIGLHIKTSAPFRNELRAEQRIRKQKLLKEGK